MLSNINSADYVEWKDTYQIQVIGDKMQIYQYDKDKKLLPKSVKIDNYFSKAKKAKYYKLSTLNSNQNI